MTGRPIDDIAAALDALIKAVTYDDSGLNGRGGNGGLLSRETIRKADEARLALSRYYGPPHIDRRAREHVEGKDQS